MEKVDADVAARKADLQAAAEHAPIEAALSPEDRRELRRLQFLEIAFESQVAVLFPPARGDAESRLKDVRRQIAALEAKAPKPGEELQAKIERQVADYRGQRVAEMEKGLEARRTALEAETAQRLEPYRKQIQEQVALPPTPEIVGATGGIGPLSRRIATPAEIASAVNSSPAPLPVAEALARLRDQRERLIRTIEDDLRARLQALASGRHWTLSYAARAGYIDVTDRAASALRSEFGDALAAEAADAGK
jgi:hypothetical protein